MWCRVGGFRAKTHKRALVWELMREWTSCPVGWDRIKDQCYIQMHATSKTHHCADNSTTTPPEVDSKSES